MLGPAQSGAMLHSSALKGRVLQPRSRVAPAQRLSRSVLVTQARFGGNAMRSSGPEIGERLLACLPYLLPFFNVITYGRYLFRAYPAVKACIQPILPAAATFHSLPFAGMIAFFGLYAGVVNNRSLPRYVRFNTMQAMLLDIVLVLPRLIETFLDVSSWSGQWYAHYNTFIFILITMWIVFGISSCLMGTWGRIPFIADAADQQVR